MPQPTPSNSSKNTMQIRMMAIGGRGIDGQIITVDDINAKTQANYFIIGYSGTTAQRPDGNLSNVALSVNDHYYDTTLGTLIVWDGRNWRLPSTGAIT